MTPNLEHRPGTEHLRTMSRAHTACSGWISNRRIVASDNFLESPPPPLSIAVATRGLPPCSVMCWNGTTNRMPLLSKHRLLRDRSIRRRKSLKNRRFIMYR
jgi:hypothetical protein